MSQSGQSDVPETAQGNFSKAEMARAQSDFDFSSPSLPAADCVLIPEDRRQSFDTVDAVLERNDASMGAQERPRLLACRFSIP